MTRKHAIEKLRDGLEAHDLFLEIDAMLYGAANGADLTVVYHAADKIAAFYVMDRVWEVDRIRNIIKNNTNNNEGTCFIVDRNILPLKNPGDTTSNLEEWYTELVLLGKGVIYAYDPDDEYTIRPYYFESVKYERFRLHVGEPIDFAEIQPGISGANTFTHFGDLNFVQKRKEAADKAKKKAQDEAKKTRGRTAHSNGRRAGKNYQTYENFGNRFSSFEEFMRWFNQNYYQSYAGGSRSTGREYSRSGASDADYELIGATRSMSNDEVKKAYRKKIRTTHPDLHPDDQNATTRTQAVNDSWERIAKDRGID